MSRLTKIVLAFLVSGVTAGMVFIALTTRPSWQSVWFSVSEFWVTPTWRYWMLAEALFVMALTGAYWWARSRQWLPSRTNSELDFWKVILATIGIAAIQLFLIQLSALPLAIYFALIPGALVIFLFGFSGRWDAIVAGLIILTNVLVTLLASIPDVFLTNSLSLVVFQSLKAILSFSAFAGLSALWLARGTRAFVDS